MFNFLFYKLSPHDKIEGDDNAIDNDPSFKTSKNIESNSSPVRMATIKPRVMDWSDGQNIIKVYDNKVPIDLLENVTDVILKNGFTYGWRSNDGLGYGHWNHVYGGFKKKNRNSVLSDLPPIMKKIWKVVQTQCMPTTPILIRCYANSHTYGVEGYPHCDSTYDQDLTAILYLNTVWKREWAGETAFFMDDEVISSILPKYGRLVVFNSSLSHVARSVSRICPEGRTVLVFKARNNESQPIPHAPKVQSNSTVATSLPMAPLSSYHLNNHHHHHLTTTTTTSITAASGDGIHAHTHEDDEDDEETTTTTTRNEDSLKLLQIKRISNEELDTSCMSSEGSGSDGF